MIPVYWIKDDQACSFDKEIHKPHKFLVYQNNLDKQLMVVACSADANIHLRVQVAAQRAKLVPNLIDDYRVVGAGVFNEFNKNIIEKWSSFDFKVTTPEELRPEIIKAFGLE